MVLCQLKMCIRDRSSLARTQRALADNPESLNQAGAHYADMEHTLKQIESLESMRDKLFELADNDIEMCIRDRICIKHSDPFPFNLLSITRIVEIGGGLRDVPGL